MLLKLKINVYSVHSMSMVTPPLTHVEKPGLGDATELNNDGIIKFVDVHYQRESNLSIFFDKDLINHDSSFCSHIFFSN